MVRFVGLDVHKRVVEACVVDGGGRVLGRHRFELTRDSLEQFARQTLTQEDQVALEATTNTWAVVRVLQPHVAEVVVSNPLRTKAIAQAKVKTDKVDAFVLAQLLRCDFLPRVWVPDEKTQELRRLTSRRAALVADRTALRNRIHSVLAQRLVVPPVKDLFGGKGLRWLREVPLDAEARVAIDSGLRLLEAIGQEIQVLETTLAQKGYADPRVKLLMTQPGVDVNVAQTVLAALGDITRFPDGDHAASFLGLVPRTKQSAEHCYHGPVTKEGTARLDGCSSRRRIICAPIRVRSAYSSGRSPGRRTITWRWSPPPVSWSSSPGTCFGTTSLIATRSPGRRRRSSDDSG